MKAAETIAAANQGRGCLGRARADEPVFVLRAQDRFAPAVVRIWAELVAAGAEADADPAKVLGARLVAADMDTWQALHGRKQPD